MQSSGNAALAHALNTTIKQGSKVKGRNGKVLRVRNLMYTFKSTPLVSTRRTAWRTALREWEWFMSGSSNIRDLHESVHPWWSPWADKEGYVDYNYSEQFRGAVGIVGDLDGFDQIGYLVENLKKDPYSRRHVITSWNTADMAAPDCPITNCHGTAIQASVEPDNSLHLTMYQRSADMALGVPHNWLQYWAFLMWLAHQTELEVGTFTWIGGDCHLYNDHLEDAKEIIKVSSVANAAPRLVYTPTSTDFLAEDFTLDRPYNPIIKKSLKLIV